MKRGNELQHRGCCHKDELQLLLGINRQTWVENGMSKNVIAEIKTSVDLMA